MRARTYVDTSVIGGCEDEEWRAHSNRLIEAFARGERVMVISDVTLDELSTAPAQVRAHLARVPAASIEAVKLGTEAIDLADAYISTGVVVPKLRPDAQHIAIATVARVDVLVSWNFRHIVNLERIHGYNSVNLRLGYPLLEIRTPREVLGDD
ncbi:MAG: PIN domain protein [Planctomycetota bacterium]